MTPPKSFSQWVLEPGNDTWLPYDDILSNVFPPSYKIRQECAILGLVFCYLCYTFVFEEEIGIPWANWETLTPSNRLYAPSKFPQSLLRSVRLPMNLQSDFT